MNGTAISAYNIGKEMGLTKNELSDLVIAASLHDIGALTVKERDELLHMDIIHVADRIEISINAGLPILQQKDKIITTIDSYKDTLFHPKAVEAFDRISEHDKFWLDIDNMELNTLLEEAISDSYEFDLTLDMLEEFAFTISKIIDTRSEFTISHSFGVSEVAYKIAGLLGYDEVKKRKIRVAGLLHDIGKIAIPTSIFGL